MNEQIFDLTGGKSVSQSEGRSVELLPKLLIAAVAEPFLKRRSEAILVETKAVELCSISLVYTNCTGGKKA